MNNQKINMKLDLHVTIVIGCFFMICISFAWLGMGEKTQNYIMLTVLMIIALVSYYLKKTTALVVSMVVDFVYCTYEFYNSITRGLTTQIELLYWIILIPVTAVLISRLAELVIDIQVKIENLSEEREKYIMIDETTGIRNASAFLNELPIYMNLNKRYKIPITLILVRIKHSNKLVNIVGNEFFNEVLKRCSNNLSDSLRFEDRKYMMDKNTFAYIIVSDEEGSLVVKNRMKEAVNDLKLSRRDLYSDLNIEVQIGSYSQNEKVTDSMSFINLAEKELDYDV